MLKVSEITIPGLAPISFELVAGECLGISGESGCGKTRLLRAIADMDEMDGSVCIDSLCQQDVSGSDWRKQVALLPAESQWWFDTVAPHFSEDNVDFASMGFSDEVMNWSVTRCSSGEKQRLAILRLLANRPKVLLLDEPTANLDAENSRKVEALITEYLVNNNASAIWVSHNHDQLQRVVSERYFDFSRAAMVSI
ncbi:MAG: ATP-binding cassette domain-containing protein [Gammaproteobacteria bacterium]|nr:ATP-binding cassette domain-containing protein [Gammaproteobacteria bacterium]MCK5262686.1 ATP-binding cassette domain-containing protein [Gammaproteobacteria bacterium]